MTSLPEEVSELLNEIPRPVPDLPEEIIKEILLRLPVKFLLRCRYVSKSWFLLISSSQFVKAHFKHFSTDRLLHPLISLDQTVDGEVLINTFATLSVPRNINDIISEDSLHINTSDGESRMVGSCNGLVCLVSRNIINIWNPTTGENRTLPFSFSLTDLGFGYDESSDDYKIVKLQSWEPFIERRIPDVKVYSLRAGSWRDVGWAYVKSSFFQGVFANGALYWPDCYDYEGKPFVVALDMTTESCSVLTLPKSCEHDSKTSLVVSEGNIWLCSLYGEHMDIWRLEGARFGDSWTKFISISNVPNPRYQYRGPLFVWETGAILVKYSLRLMLYKDADFHEVRKLPNSMGSEVIAYRESLFSPFLKDVLC